MIVTRSPKLVYLFDFTSVAAVKNTSIIDSDGGKSNLIMQTDLWE